jgi:hypothetical protein
MRMEWTGFVMIPTFFQQGRDTTRPGEALNFEAEID